MADSRSSGRARRAPRHQRGLVEEEHEAGVGERRRPSVLDRDRPRARDLGGAAERTRARDAGRVQRDAERERSRDLRLDALRRRFCGRPRRRGTSSSPRVTAAAKSQTRARRRSRAERSTTPPRRDRRPREARPATAPASLREGRAPGAAVPPGGRGGSATPARPRRPGRRAAGCRCRSRLRERAPALGGSATWVGTLRSPTPHAPSGRTRRVNGVDLPRPLFLWLLRAAWLTLPVTAGPAAGAAIESWATRHASRPRSCCGSRGRSGLLAILAPRPQTLDRVAGHRAGVRRRRGARDDRRIRVDGRVRRRGARDRRVQRARVRTRHRVGGRRTRSRTATSSASRSAFRLRSSSDHSPSRVCSSPAGVVAPVLLLADGGSSLGVVALVVGGGLAVVLSRSLESPARVDGRCSSRRASSSSIRSPWPTRRCSSASTSVTSPPRHRGRPAGRPRPAARRDRGLGLGGVRRGGRTSSAASRGRRGGATVATAEIRIALPRRDEMLRGWPRGRAPPGADPRQVAIPPPTSASPS